MSTILKIIPDPLDYFNYPQSEKTIFNSEVRIEKYMDSINELTDSAKMKIRLSAVDLIIANLNEEIEGFILSCKGIATFITVSLAIVTFISKIDTSTNNILVTSIIIYTLLSLIGAGLAFVLKSKYHNKKIKYEVYKNY